MAATLWRHGWERAGLDLSGFGGVLALVLAETVAGAAALTWCTPLWNEAKRSYFALWGVVVTVVFALWAWWAARSVAPPGDAAAAWSVRLALATLVAVALSALLLLLRRRAPSLETAGRIVGIVSVPIAVATLAVMAATGRQAYAVALFQLLAGAAFLGAAFDGLFLGHWYLTDRKLTREPINRATDALLIASVVEIVAVVTSGFGSTASSQDFNPLLTAGALAPWIAVGMAAATLLIAVLVRAALKGERANAVQSATGFYYLAVVTAFTAEIAREDEVLPGIEGEKTMRTIVVVVGLIVLMVAWWLVATRRRQLWHVIPLVMAGLGITAILLMPPADPQVSDGTALAVGAVSGIAMFLATRLFVALAVLWKPFARHVEAAYREAAEEPFVRSLVLSLLVSVPCEELFWRGLAQRTLAETWIGAGGAFVAVWLLYVLGNAPKPSLPIIAGAVVGGALWGALAWWSGGLIAPLASHVLWTGLMLVLPPAIGKRTSAVAPGEPETHDQGVGRP